MQIYSSIDPLQCKNEVNAQRRIFLKDLIHYMENNFLFKNSQLLLKAKYGLI